MSVSIKTTFLSSFARPVPRFSGNHNCFVAAMVMMPLQIRIADIIARSSDHPDETEQKEPRIAFLEDGSIYIEPLLP